MSYSFQISRAPITYTTKYHLFHKGLNVNFTGFTQTGSIVTLYYSVPLTEQQQSDIQVADVSFVDNDPLETIRNNILVPARTFGQLLIDDFAAENILLGITQSGMTNQIRKTLTEATLCLLTGSLYDAIHEAREIPEEEKDGVFINNARLLSFINRIESYLGLPLSTEV
jgi:hypothetical protein